MGGNESPRIDITGPRDEIRFYTEKIFQISLAYFALLVSAGALARTNILSGLAHQMKIAPWQLLLFVGGALSWAYLVLAISCLHAILKRGLFIVLHADPTTKAWEVFSRYLPDGIRKRKTGIYRITTQGWNLDNYFMLPLWLFSIALASAAAIVPLYLGIRPLQWPAIIQSGLILIIVWMLTQLAKMNNRCRLETKRLNGYIYQGRHDSREGYNVNIESTVGEANKENRHGIIEHLSSLRRMRRLSNLEPGDWLSIVCFILISSPEIAHLSYSSADPRDHHVGLVWAGVLVMVFVAVLLYVGANIPDWLELDEADSVSVIEHSYESGGLKRLGAMVLCVVIGGCIVFFGDIRRSMTFSISILSLGLAFPKIPLLPFIILLLVVGATWYQVSADGKYQLRKLGRPNVPKIAAEGKVSS